ncbi:MAG: hypothetical protein JXB44_00255 [Calditrichaceae bacterium]|nr:hypothetical protein [Calditrichaceae bacterium]
MKIGRTTPPSEKRPSVAGQAGSTPMIILSDINCLLIYKDLAQGATFAGIFLS